MNRQKQTASSKRNPNLSPELVEVLKMLNSLEKREIPAPATETA
jgi:hypothetical protein